MERLFSPCTRLQDAVERFIGMRVRPLRELNLDVSPQEFLSADRAFTYADLRGMLNNLDTVAWLTPHAAVSREIGSGFSYWDDFNETFRFCFNADGNKIVASARSHEHLLEICNVVLRLLAASVVRSVILQKPISLDSGFINAPTLAYLMEQCQSLNNLILVNLEMDGNHCRALGAFSRPDLEIISLIQCKLTSAGASALAEVLGRNQGPTELAYCYIENAVLANGLRGNSRLKRLTPRMASSLEDDNRQVLAIAGALQENKGLVELKLCHDHRVCDETWNSVCDSLKTHPTLQVLDLSSTNNDATTAPGVITSRVQALLDMMKTNMSIHTIHLNSHYSEDELFRESVIPHLGTNRFRPCVHVIQKTRPMAYRAKVLGRALLAARTDANRFWMLLSGNPEIAFPSTTATITPATDLPPPASSTAAASSTANVAAVAASVQQTIATSSLPTAASAATLSTASDAFAPTVAAATNDATPSARQKRNSARQKRKARP
jgi:hypothetical protein